MYNNVRTVSYGSKVLSAAILVHKLSAWWKCRKYFLCVPVRPSEI